MNAQRLPDWPEQLVRFVDEARGRPFEWGEHDCVTAAADWVAQCTGVDPIADLRGRWTSAAEAARVIAELGGLEPAITARLGAPLKSPLFAQRGDLALLRIDGRQTLAVVIGADVVGPGEDGLVPLPVASAEVAWRV